MIIFFQKDMHNYCMWQNYRNNYVLMSQMMEFHHSSLKINLVTQAELQQLSHPMMALEALPLLLRWHFDNAIRWSWEPPYSCTLFLPWKWSEAMLTFVGWPALKDTLSASISAASDRCVQFILQNKSNFLSQSSCLPGSLLHICRFIIGFAFLTLVCARFFMSHLCWLILTLGKNRWRHPIWSITWSWWVVNDKLFGC